MKASVFSLKQLFNNKIFYPGGIQGGTLGFYPGGIQGGTLGSYPCAIQGGILGSIPSLTIGEGTLGDVKNVLIVGKIGKGPDYLFLTNNPFPYEND